MSGKLLLKLEAITFILQHHTAEHFAFLDDPANARNRTTFYHTLAKLLFMEDTPSKFKSFVAPLQQVRAAPLPRSPWIVSCPTACCGTSAALQPCDEACRLRHELGNEAAQGVYLVKIEGAHHECARMSLPPTFAACCVRPLGRNRCWWRWRRRATGPRAPRRCGRRCPRRPSSA